MNAPDTSKAERDLDDLVLDFLSASLNSSLEWTAVSVARVLDRSMTVGVDEVRRYLDSLDRLVDRGLVRRSRNVIVAGTRTVTYRVRVGAIVR